MGQVQFISPRIGGDWSILCRNHQPISLLKMARIFNVPLPVHCQEGICGTCAVQVTPQQGIRHGHLSPVEKRTLHAVGKVSCIDEGDDLVQWKGPRWRLACQCMVETSDQFFVAF